MSAQAIRLWTRAGAVVSLCHLGLFVAAPSLPVALQAGPPWPRDSALVYLTIPFVVACSFAILFRSRAAAFLALTGAGSSPFLAYAWSGSWWRLVVDLPLVIVLAKSFEAMLEHHRNTLSGKPVTRWWTIGRPVMRWAVVLIVLVTIWALATMPPGYVMSGRQLPAAYRAAIDQMKLLEPGEQVVYFSSDAFWDVRRGMYLLTDRRLILHSDTWSEPTHRVEFSQVANILLLGDADVPGSSYVVIMFDDASELMFPLSQQGQGDARFHEALVSAWRSRRPALNDGRA